MKGTVQEGDCTRRRRYMTGTVYKKTVHEGDCVHEQDRTKRRRYMTGTLYEETVNKGNSK